MKNFHVSIMYPIFGVWRNVYNDSGRQTAKVPFWSSAMLCVLNLTKCGTQPCSRPTQHDFLNFVSFIQCSIFIDRIRGLNSVLYTLFVYTSGSFLRPHYIVWCKMSKRWRKYKNKRGSFIDIYIGDKYKTTINFLSSILHTCHCCMFHIFIFKNAQVMACQYKYSY